MTLLIEDWPPAWSPDGTKVAFARGDVEGSVIWLMGAGTMRERRLINLPVRGFHPFWSPDGTRIVFAGGRGANTDILITELNSSHNRSVTNASNNFLRPSYSPSGSMIAFEEHRGSVRVVDLGGGPDLEQGNAQFPGSAFHHAWAPDSKRVAFLRNLPIESVLCVKDLLSGGIRKLAEDLHQASLPAWSPDGSVIAFAGGRAGNWDIHAVAVESGDTRRLTSTAELSFHPAWSPDGKQIAFGGGRSTGYALYVFNIEEGSTRVLAEDAQQLRHPAWSPDGTLIAFVSGRPGECVLSIVNIGHGSLHQPPARPQAAQQPEHLPQPASKTTPMIGPAKLLDYFADDHGYNLETPILFDLDETLIRTDAIRLLRQRGRWSEVVGAFDLTRLPPSTREFVAFAKTIAQIGVVTSSPRFYAEALLAHHGLDIDVIVAYHDVPPDRQKPWPDSILKAAELLDHHVEDCLYIGDQANDVRAADAAGAASIGINWTTLDVFDGVRGMTLGCFSDWEGVRNLLAPRREPMARENVANNHDYSDDLDGRWIDDDYATLKYTPSRCGYMHTSRLILNYKSNRPAAVQRINRFAIRDIERMESEMRDERRCQYIVGLPSSRRGPCAAHIRSTCKALVDRFDWLQDGTDWLVRTEDVASSAAAAAGQRPSLQAHLSTMTYTGAPRSHLPRNASIIMVDDVITAGR